MALSNSQLEILHRKLQQLLGSRIQVDGNRIIVGQSEIKFNSQDKRTVVNNRTVISR